MKQAERVKLRLRCLVNTCEWLMQQRELPHWAVEDIEEICQEMDDLEDVVRNEKLR